MAKVVLAAEMFSPIAHKKEREQPRRYSAASGMVRTVFFGRLVLKRACYGTNDSDTVQNIDTSRVV